MFLLNFTFNAHSILHKCAGKKTLCVFYDFISEHVPNPIILLLIIHQLSPIITNEHVFNG